MESPIVSFCIATFQRYEILEELIHEILSVQSDKIEVVVCDDKSTDGSIDKIKKINDRRLRIFVNKENVGSSLNIHESLDKGNGKYLFYVNDRDNVDPFKIKKLLEIIEELHKKNVAFAKCHITGGNAEKYHIFKGGKEALLQFSCRIDHPTGYIFKRDIWKIIKNKRLLFENENFGDYPITQICAIMAKNYSGALIYGDICDLKRRRVNFQKIKSGYYIKRKDKRLWYTPEVIYRELVIGQKFLKKIGVCRDIREQILLDRYTEYLSWCVTNYKDKITDPVCTAHYNFYPYQDFFHVFAFSIWNGIKLWGRTYGYCAFNGRKLCLQINRLLWKEYEKYFAYILKSNVFTKWKLLEDYRNKDEEIHKREEALRIYERWMDASIDKKSVSDYLLKNGYNHVGIYGMGRVGSQLWKEFRNSKIQVDYIVDKKMGKKTQYYEDIPCLDLESEIPSTDIIIVTISSQIESVVSELRKKVKCQIRTINDILFVS